MLEGIFLTVVNMSIIGSLAIILILAVRMLLLKAPKVFSYCLWAVVLFRLLVPFSFDSVVSLIPINKQPVPLNLVSMQTPAINTGITSVDEVVSSALPTATNVDGTSMLPLLITIMESIWVAVMLAMVVYGLYSLFKLKHKLSSALSIEGNIYQSEYVDTPFVLGIIKPKIYLPVGLNETEREYILLHEQNHIRRGDHIIRIVSYLALCIHWFNPLVWIAFKTSGKDMEMANDESVIRKKGDSIKIAYSTSLLALSTGKRGVSPVPLAFGEEDPRGRIMNIINYKKPALWVAIASIIFVVAISAGVLLNSEEDNLLENTATPGTTEYQIIDTINSVKDQDDRQKIITLCFTTAFGGESGSDTPAPNNELSSKALLDIVNKLAALSGEDLDMEISREVKASIEKNIENPNIQWDRHFIETIVKTYCPEYYDRMIKIVDSYEGGGN